MSSVGLAVFGAGRIGAVHARNVARRISGAHLVGVGDVDLAAARRLVEETGIGRADDPQAFLHDPNVQAVIIATPTETHAELIASSAQAGKHIFCEKPISSTLASTNDASERARNAGVILQVGFQRRFDAEFQAAHRAVQSGALGEPRLLRLVGRDHRMPPSSYLRTSGGQFKDQMVHEFDLARWLFSPREVQEVYATGSAIVDPSIESFGDVDTSIVILRFLGGALCVIDDSREAIYGYDVRAELHGAQGLLLVGHGRLHNAELLGARAATQDVDSFIERFADAYRLEMVDFVETIRERREPKVTAKDALEALRLAIAADRSKQLRRPVALSEVNDG